MDPIQSLIDDHRKVESILVAFEQGEIGPDDQKIELLVRELSIHAAVEEVVVYPGFHAASGLGDTLVPQNLQEHQLVKELLIDIERSSSVDRVPLLTALAAYVRAHVEHEEGSMFPKLRRFASDQELADMGEALERTRKIAPTHPHPHAPRDAPAVVPAGVAAGLLDKARDALHRR